MEKGGTVRFGLIGLSHRQREQKMNLMAIMVCGECVIQLYDSSLPVRLIVFS